MQKIIEQLKNLFSVSGRENELLEEIQKELLPFCDKVYFDKLGNLIAKKTGVGPKLLITAACDFEGAVVTNIEENGFIRFAPMHISPINALNRKVVFENNIEGIVCHELGTELKDISINKMYVKICSQSQKQTEALVKVGKAFQFSKPSIETENEFIGGNIDLLAPLAILISIIKNREIFPFDISCVFSALSLTGNQGLSAATYDIEPEIGISISAGEKKSAKKDETEKSGAIIRLADIRSISNRKLVQHFLSSAKEYNIPVNQEVSFKTATAASVMQSIRNGVVVLDIAVPVTGLGTAACSVLYSDVELTYNLILRAISTPYKVMSTE